MELVHLPPNSLRIGQTLTFSLRDAAGKLLFAAGQPLPDSELVRQLIARGAYVPAHETRDYQRALAHKMDTLMLQGASLQQIAGAHADFQAERPTPSTQPLTEQALWADLQLRAHSLLRDPAQAGFLTRLEQLRSQALTRLEQAGDAALLLLIYDAGQDHLNYSARHALLSLLLAELSARQLGWPLDWREALGRAALSMNLAISAQQDRHAAQVEGLSASQRQQLTGHGDRGAALLQTLGVDDALWLSAVRLHHEAGPGTLAARSPGEQLARLLRRVDQYGARLSPRRNRRALSAALAAHAVYLDELGQPDEAGAALIKAVGLYPPGSLVRLAQGEQGMVIKRGHSANLPLVAALIGKSGNPLSDPVPRDTRLASQAIAASLAPHELRLRVQLERLLKL